MIAMMVVMMMMIGTNHDYVCEDGMAVTVIMALAMNPPYYSIPVDCYRSCAGHSHVQRLSNREGAFKGVSLQHGLCQTIGSSWRWSFLSNRS